MTKPKMTEMKKLLGTMENKIKKLREEIKNIEAKKVCPFWAEFGSDSINACLYMHLSSKCEDLEICPSNGDAWCHRMIGAAVGEKAQKKCPFWGKFNGSTIRSCIYLLLPERTCANLEKCPSDANAWCSQQIENSFDVTKPILEKDIAYDLKRILKKYADQRCSGCDIAET